MLGDIHSVTPRLTQWMQERRELLFTAKEIICARLNAPLSWVVNSSQVHLKMRRTDQKELDLMPCRHLQGIERRAIEKKYFLPP